jgi:zinc transport system ATP-binding protein
VRHFDKGSGAGRLASADALVTVEDVSVEIGGRTILQAINLNVASGEIVTVIGPNGAGKTMLIRVLIGLIRPTAGRVQRRPGLRVGYLPQKLALDPVLPLTVSRLMTLTVRRSRTKVEAALAETGAGHLIDAAVGTLSGGEMQRVLLARSLLREPDLLVLDEPVQGVDFAGASELYDLIHTIRARRGCGILMVSHDLHVVMAATDQVVCINRHICCAGTPQHVGGHPEYARLFGPRAAQTVAIYAHRHDHRHGADGQVVPLAEAGARSGHRSRSST